MGRNRKDLIGWKMWEHGFPDSKLTVIDYAPDFIDKNGRHWPQWLCECSCEDHNRIIVASRDLTHKSHYTKSCGCLFGNLNRKKNKFNIETYDYGIGWTLNTNNEFYFDLEDYDKIKNYCWYEIVDNTGYHTLNARIIGSGICIKMSHLLGFKQHDHIDRNPLNNRKNNFRECTQNENSANRSLFKNNNSGFTGVYFRKDNGYWTAQITVNSNQIYLGQFITKKDAVIARLQAEAKYFKDFAPQRHLFEEYGIVYDGGVYADE